MHPNYNFDNEISEQYNIKNYQFRTMAANLLNKYKVIKQKEYDIIMWMGCNLPTSSVVREVVFSNLKKVESELKLKELNNLQIKMEL